MKDILPLAFTVLVVWAIFTLLAVAGANHLLSLLPSILGGMA